MSIIHNAVSFATVNVLVIAKDDAKSRTLVNAIQCSGLTVTKAHAGAAAVTLSQSAKFDVVLVGAELPDSSWMDVISWFDRTACGIMALSDSDSEGERILALELGADDIIASGAAPREIVARIRAIYRRAIRRLPREQAFYGGLCIDFNRGIATTQGERLKLTAAEFTVLELLATHAGQVVSRDALSEKALRRPWRAEDRAIDQLVFTLRQKLPVDEADGALIQTVRCGGYRMRLPDAVPMKQSLQSGRNHREAALVC